MNSTWIRTSHMVFGILLSANVVFAQSQSLKPDKADTSVDEAEVTTPAAKGHVSLAVARDRAKLMHDVYTATLDVMHHRYFHADRAIIPARAMEDVFSEMQRQANIEARWIAVSFKPMSVNHEAETDFEKQAAKAIASGKPHFDAVENGYYRRAGAIPLGSNCISCHDGFFRKAPKKPRFAGLVISVPIQSDSKPSK